MPLTILRNDITRMKVDAIVNAANSSLLGGGGVDGAIHRAAGPRLLEACRKLRGCKTGEVKATPGFLLSCRYVLHTVGPIYADGKQGEREKLVSCYEKSLQLAMELECKSIAFPLISAGVYGYPKEEALHVAVETVGSFLLKQELDVYLVIFDKKSFAVSKELCAYVQECIDDHYAELRELAEERRFSPSFNKSLPSQEIDIACRSQEFIEFSLAERVEQLDESFSQMLLRKIDQSGQSDAWVYKRANIDRRLFSKIRSQKDYKPSKPTALAFAVALRLDIKETEELLKKAGYALSHSSKFDIIIEYFIQRGEYDIFTINEALFAFDQSLLGA